ncbi:hypothetical protein ACHWQZ_G012370 [Mnemiopsis leidyi]
MNKSDVHTTEPPDYVYFVIRELDIFIGIVYLLFGLFGIYSNGSILTQYWSLRRTIKVLPFTLCSLVLAANDMMFCTLGITPYAILILAARPVQASFPEVFCKIFGFVNNFCDRFSWFNITSIMVFRCITMAFPLKLRGITYHPFVYILSSLAMLQGIICMFPFFEPKWIETAYEYEPNFGDCSYGFNAELVPWMISIVDVLWWGPFLACIVSCVLFFFFMKLHAAKITSSQKSDKSNDAKKKTALLTAFFIICYLPKALFILFEFLINTEQLITWEMFESLLDNEADSLRLYVYMSLVCKFVIPASRAAFTPTMLRLKDYLRRCSTSKRKKTSTTENSRFSIVKGASLLKIDLFKKDSKHGIDKDSDVKTKTNLKKERQSLLL